MVARGRDDRRRFCLQIDETPPGAGRSNVVEHMCYWLAKRGRMTMDEMRTSERAVVIAEPNGDGESRIPEPTRAIDVIRPVAPAEEVLAAWHQFQDLKRSLLTL